MKSVELDAAIIAKDKRIAILETALSETILLADEAMKRANNDGAEYDRKECLADSRAALGQPANER